ncbi:hypothetical protein HanXRQr2_Chr16g0766701 [Helianthus annuus]|uniref:Uncharacterized protein n=1 Tax=Helianthus annuus TaxID=4232 RepID=A0A9K3H1U3_HELAN|nr:hypothetical protein HanXRQr2_Chr16g0766701 [Helianthus annuus]
MLPLSSVTNFIISLLLFFIIVIISFTTSSSTFPLSPLFSCNATAFKLHIFWVLHQLVTLVISLLIILSTSDSSHITVDHSLN